MLRNVGILIPAFNPDAKLTELLFNLNGTTSFDRLKIKLTIIVIDDGSFNIESRKIFNEIETTGSAYTIVHKENLGKGSAIKTGIKYLKNKGVDSIVTVDADGQHHMSDILSVLKTSLKEGELVLGVRSFNYSDIPFKSKFGNVISSFLFYCFTGLKIRDTQTGLRAFPRRHFDYLLTIAGKRYEYEFNVLITFAKKRKKILTFPIKTIYFENNQNSSFRPIIDSLFVYSVFIKYSIVALLIAALDFSLIYALIYFLPESISFLLVRLFTSHIYFYIMKTKVFNFSGNFLNPLLKYYALLIFNAVLSWQLFDFIFFQSNYSYSVAYFSVTAILSIINFFLQKYLIFR